MLFTWNFETQKLYSCVDLSCYPAPKDGQKVTFAVCDQHKVLVDQFVTYEVTIVSTKEGNRIKLNETGFSRVLQLFHIGSPMRDAIQSQYDETIKHTPDYFTRPTENLVHFKQLEVYGVALDGACYPRCFLAKHCKSPSWLTERSRKQVSQKLLACNVKPHFLNAINTSFTVAINHVHQLPDYIKNYFASHPKFAENIFNATIERARFILFISLQVRANLHDFPQSRTAMDQRAIQQFFIHFVDGIFLSCQQGLDFYTNSYSPEHTVQMGTPIALIVAENNHYEFLASPDYFDENYQAEPLPDVTTSQVLMTKTCSESLLRCAIAYKHKDRNWLSLDSRNKEAVIAEFERLEYKKIFLAAFQAEIAKRLQSKKENPSFFLPSYIYSIEFNDKILLDKIFNTLFLEANTESRHALKLQYFLSLEEQIQKEAQTIAEGNRCDWDEVDLTLECNDGKNEKWEHFQFRKVKNQNTENEKPFPFPISTFEQEVLYSILEEVTKLFLKVSGIPDTPSETNDLAFIGGSNGNYCIYAPDDFFKQEESSDTATDNDTVENFTPGISLETKEQQTQAFSQKF
ncbi:hypothetical protein D5018_09645 [Parashewanella curva]|uniref:Uncharacterized protein n=1 Tax=Parashewanella curva TaxID=2338552 RepID=A0A3L8PXE2_9GAMM|nr:hypothetical protein [Parashewanella curva]RLV59935.1 hypothetical protein D5018_09645 [Parashewanella curva]